VIGEVALKWQNGFCQVDFFPTNFFLAGNIFLFQNTKKKVLAGKKSTWQYYTKIFKSKCILKKLNYRSFQMKKPHFIFSKNKNHIFLTQIFTHFPLKKILI
jgi:hypothetical protein